MIDKSREKDERKIMANLTKKEISSITKLLGLNDKKPILYYRKDCNFYLFENEIQSIRKVFFYGPLSKCSVPYEVLICRIMTSEI